MDSPFSSEPLEEVPLSAAPLVRTLAQIRFASQSVLVTSEDAAMAMASAMQEEFPVFESARETTITFTPDGVEQKEGEGRLWRLKSGDETWQVSFASTFISLDTSVYTSRDDFCARLQRIWATFNEVVSSPAPQRIGFRYINRIDDLALLQRLPELVRAEVLGVTTLDVPRGGIVHSMSDNMFVLGDVASHMDTLQTRFGLVPPNTTLDPTLPPADGHAWVLDMDSARSYKSASGLEVNVPETVKSLGHAGYRFFRWAVTNEFLRTFGGNPSEA